MIPSRKLAAMFLCVFVLGGIAGALIVWNFSPMRFSDFLNRTSDPDSLARRIDSKLAAQYNLSADEQARIAPESRQLADNLYHVRQQFADQVLATIDTAHEKIGAQMDADHRAAYLKDNVARRARAAAMLLPVAVTNQP